MHTKVSLAYCHAPQASARLQGPHPVKSQSTSGKVQLQQGTKSHVDQGAQPHSGNRAAPLSDPEAEPRSGKKIRTWTALRQEAGKLCSVLK